MMSYVAEFTGYALIAALASIVIGFVAHYIDWLVDSWRDRVRFERAREVGNELLHLQWWAESSDARDILRVVGTEYMQNGSLQGDHMRQELARLIRERASGATR